MFSLTTLVSLNLSPHTQGWSKALLERSSVCSRFGAVECWDMHSILLLLLTPCFCSDLWDMEVRFLNFTLSDSLSLFLYSHIKNYKGGNARRKIKDIKQSHKRSKCKPEKQQDKRGVGKGSDFFWGGTDF